MYPAGAAPALLYATVVGPLSVRRGRPAGACPCRLPHVFHQALLLARYKRRPLAGVPLHHASFPWSGTVGVDTRFPARPASGRGCPPVRSVACSQQALTWPVETSNAGGTCSAHTVMACGHRGWKRQPVGGFTRLGGAPRAA